MSDDGLQLLGLFERLDADLEATGRGVCIGFIDGGFYPHLELLRPRRRIKTYADVTRTDPQPNEFFLIRPESWHGTMTACCAAASGYLSAGRYRGLAYEADVVFIKAASADGRLHGRNVASAIRLPLRRPELAIRVLSVSVGVDKDDPDAHDVERAVKEVTDAGVVVVVAAGNTAEHLPEPPASAREALTVGGIDDQNTRARDDDAPWPSSAGETHPGVFKPDLLAPATRLPAPMLPGTRTAREADALFQLRAVLEEYAVEHTFSDAHACDADEVASVGSLLDAVRGRIASGRFIDSHHQRVEGTSFAAPITASVVAQMLEVAPRLTPKQVREGLVATARPLDGLPQESQGAGVVSPRAAVAWARERATT